MYFSRQQVDVLQRSQLARFAGELCQHYRTHHADLVAAVDEPALLSRVQSGIARALEHGLVARRDLGFYVGLHLALGPSFDRHPRVRAILEDQASPPEERAARLATDLPDQVWYEAATLSGPIP